MYKPPFVRRVLPWLYVLAFFIVAPILLFYTAGYRYNVKKRLVERNGALIVDGSPKGAAIFLDGINTGNTTPYTFQNVIPGWHTIRVEKVGYSTWEKHLEIRAEQVTFANAIRLWPQISPTLVSPHTFLRLESNPKGTGMATLSVKERSLEAGLWTPRAFSSSALPIIATSSVARLPLRWNSEGTSFVLNGISSSSPSFSITPGSILRADQVPAGVYTWSDEYTLLGTDDAFMTQLQTRSNRLSRTPLPTHSVFTDGNLLLQTTGTPPALWLTKNSLRDRVYELSSLGARIVDRFGDLIIFKRAKESEWLAVNIGDALPRTQEARGDYPRWLAGSSLAPKALLVDGGEVWLWNPNASPLLLWRQPEPIVQAAWHPDGDQIILADRTHVFALDLDDRNGRITTSLGEFENIHDVAFLRRQMYVAGQREGKEGLWEFILEP